MLEGFKTAFGAALGLVAALLAFFLLAGIVDWLNHAVKMARWKKQLKR
jgi:hypothetical protein